MRPQIKETKMSRNTTLVLNMLAGSILENPENESQDFQDLIDACEAVTNSQNFLVDFAKRVAQQKAINEVERRAGESEFANVNLDDFVRAAELRGSMREILENGRELLLDSLNAFDIEPVKQAVKGVQL